VTLIAVLVAGTGAAHEALSLEELTQVWGVDIDAMEVTVETVSPGIHVLFGAGGNVAVSIGDQGVLMVDSQFPQMIPKLRAAIRELGGGDVDFTINTHWHFDHADGNPTLGREGTWMVSHSNSRRMMTGTHPVDLVAAVYDQPPYPAEGLPVITYDDRMQFHFNGQKIDLMHLGPAHTTGDTAVFFRSSNVVHMGDVFNRGYPFVDVGNGGDLEGLISFCKAVLDELNEDTVVIPGHGPVGGVDDLAAYIGMLETVRDRISAMIDQGKTLEEVVAAKPTAEFDETYGDPGTLVNRGYVSLAR
jgi:glyoxylase-like metal-dependent hydrolase (beta-lactamase superfamily II)